MEEDRIKKIKKAMRINNIHIAPIILIILICGLLVFVILEKKIYLIIGYIILVIILMTFIAILHRRKHGNKIELNFFNIKKEKIEDARYNNSRNILRIEDLVFDDFEDYDLIKNYNKFKNGETSEFTSEFCKLKYSLAIPEIDGVVNILILVKEPLIKDNHIELPNNYKEEIVNFVNNYHIWLKDYLNICYVETSKKLNYLIKNNKEVDDKVLKIMKEFPTTKKGLIRDFNVYVSFMPIEKSSFYVGSPIWSSSDGIGVKFDGNTYEVISIGNEQE